MEAHELPPTELRALYLTLFFRNSPPGDLYHWAFYSDLGDEGRVFFDAVRSKDTGAWGCRTRDDLDIESVLQLVALVKIGSMKENPNNRGLLHDIFSSVDIGFSTLEPELDWACNVWTADALHKLDDRGE